MKKFRSHIILIIGIFLSGCVDDSYDSASIKQLSPETSTSSLSERLLRELESNLNTNSNRNSNKSRSSAITSFNKYGLNELSARTSTKDLSNSLNSSQINQIIETARKAISYYGLEDSENLILLMPKIIEGAQSKLASIGLSDPDETIKVINVIVNSMVKSVNGRNQYLPDNYVDS